MFIGFVLMVIGVILPFLMVLRLWEPTLWLNVVAYFASFIGLAIGLLGVVQYGMARRRDKEE